MKKNKIWTCILLSTLGITGAAFAAAPSNASTRATSTVNSASSEIALTSGVLRKVDAELGRLTIKHEAIINLDMPAMIMVFHVSKPEMLMGFNAGDRIRFRAESVAGSLIITRIEVAP